MDGGWMDAWIVDGWMNGWMNSCMDGRHMCVHVLVRAVSRASWQRGRCAGMSCFTPASQIPARHCWPFRAPLR
eukprot:364320-Chlamydomonas_euryale.AAC.14